MMATGGFTELSDPFYRDWKKKFYATKNMFTFTASPQTQSSNNSPIYFQKHQTLRASRRSNGPNLHKNRFQSLDAHNTSLPVASPQPINAIMASTTYFSRPPSARKAEEEPSRQGTLVFTRKKNKPNSRFNEEVASVRSGPGSNAGSNKGSPSSLQAGGRL